MKNPFPALIAYMLIHTAITYPLPSFIVVGLALLVGWGMALSDLLNAKSYYKLPEATYLE